MIIIDVSIAVASFLLNTGRVLKAIELCKESLILVNNKAFGNGNPFHQLCCRDIYSIMFTAYYLVPDYTNAINHGEKFLATLHELGEKVEEGEVAIAVAEMCESQCKHAKAEDLYERAINIRAEIGDQKGEAEVRENLANMFRTLGEHVKWEKQLERALTIRIAINDRKGEEEDRGILGTVLMSLGSYFEAKEYLEQALAIAVQIGDREGEGIYYGNLGTVFRCRGDYDKAKQYLEEALAIAIEIGDRKGEVPCYGNLGTVFTFHGDYDKAEECYDKELAIAIEIDDKEGEATAYHHLGTVLAYRCYYDKAKELLEKALAMFIKIGHRAKEGSCYGNLGTVLESLGNYVKAEEYLQKALKIAIETGDRGLEAASYGNLGRVFKSRDYDRAKKYFEDNLAIVTKIGDKAGEASCYAELGQLLCYLGDHNKGKEYLEKALAMAIDIGERAEAATRYISLGEVFKNLGDFAKGKEYLEKALAIKTDIGDREGEAVCYGNLGDLFLYLGNYVKAKENIEKALKIANEIGTLANEEVNFGNLGTLFIKLGDFGNCQECLEKALAIADEIGDRRGELTHYTNLGYVFKFLGDYEKAKEYLEKALSMATKIGDKQKETYCHLNLGTVYLSLENYADAENHLQEALLIATETGIRTLEAAAHHRLGNLFQSLSRRNSDEAKKSYGKALAISREIGERERQAATYVDLGSLYIDDKEYGKAEEHLQKAFSIGKELHHFGIEFSCCKHFAMAKIPQGKKQEALPYLWQSIQKCEDGRSFLKDNDELKVLYSDVHSFPYKKLSTLFCDIGNPNKALSVEELGRARGLSDLMAAQYSLEMPIATDPQLLDGIENVTNNLESNSTCLYISYDNSDVFLWILKRRGVVEFRRNTVDRTTNLHMFLDTISESFRSFGILPPELCEDRSFNGFEQIPDSSHEENLADIGQRSPQHDPDDHSVEQNLIFLYKMIIAPVADLLEGSEIIIVPDRHLYRVPFPALLDDSGKYLSETFRIRIVPSLTTLKCIQDSPADYHSQTGALIVGDPDVGKVMWKGRRITIPPLPSARKEAEMVGRLLGVQPLIGQQATKQAVLERINSVSLIHFAAHGNEEKGEIILVPVRTGGQLPRETDCLLTVGDISQVQLRAKLVVLSCCHSGRGHIKVEGVVGMARAFLGSGARSVLVSLWAVDDEATEQLMSRFYEHLYRGVSASESLHQAMKWMRDNGFAKVSEWAPFMLIGDNVTFDFGNKRSDELSNVGLQADMKPALT